MKEEWFVYILSNFLNNVVYVGFTSNLENRVKAHKSGNASQFTSKYNVNKLVYFEKYNDKQTAFKRERQIKKYRRSKKDMLIIEHNPTWNDINFNSLENDLSG